MEIFPPIAYDAPKAAPVDGEKYKRKFWPFHEIDYETLRREYVQAGIRTLRWEKWFSGKFPEGERDASGRHPGEVPGDGNVYDHQRRQATLVRHYGALDIGSPALAAAKLMAPDALLSKKGWYKMRILSLLHDMGETGTTWADVTYDQKMREPDANKKTREALELAAALQFVGRVVTSRTAAGGRKNKMRKALAEILSLEKHPKSPYKDLFHGYEKLSYMWGAVAAFRNAQTLREHGGHPVPLARNVLGNQIPKMTEWAKDGAPSFQAFLRDYGPDVDALFAACDAYPAGDFARETAELFQATPDKPEFTPEAEEANLRSNYAKARDAWAAWKAFDAGAGAGTMGRDTTA